MTLIAFPGAKERLQRQIVASSDRAMRLIEEVAAYFDRVRPSSLDEAIDRMRLTTALLQLGRFALALRAWAVDRQVAADAMACLHEALAELDGCMGHALSATGDLVAFQIELNRLTRDLQPCGRAVARCLEAAAA